MIMIHEKRMKRINKLILEDDEDDDEAHLLYWVKMKMKMIHLTLRWSLVKYNNNKIPSSSWEIFSSFFLSIIIFLLTLIPFSSLSIIIPKSYTHLFPSNLILILIFTINIICLHHTHEKVSIVNLKLFLYTQINTSYNSIFNTGACFTYPPPPSYSHSYLLPLTT